MTVPDDTFDVWSQMMTIKRLGLIPVMLVVFDQQTNEETDRYLVGCHCVPQIDEVIDYGETRLQVFGVRHEFVNTKTMPKDVWSLPDVWIQSVSVAAWEQYPDEAAE